MRKVVAKLVIELSIDVDDALDEDQAFEIAREVFEEDEQTGPPRAMKVVRISRMRCSKSVNEVSWSVPEYIDTEFLRIE